MDNRFPRWLRATVSTLSFVAIPNLGFVVAGLAVLGFVGTHFLGLPLERFLFTPEAVLNGEYWRLFSFPGTETNGNVLFFLVYVMYVHFVFSALEQSWGTAPLTIFTLLSYACAVGASFIADRSLQLWYHVLENVSLAFGTLFPELELYLFFVLPVKAKWLAMLAGAILFLQFVVGSANEKLFTVVILAPYLIFFGPHLLRLVRAQIQKRNNRNRY